MDLMVHFRTLSQNNTLAVDLEVLHWVRRLLHLNEWITNEYHSNTITDLIEITQQKAIMFFLRHHPDGEHW